MGAKSRYTSYVGGGKVTSAHKLLSELFPASADNPTMQKLQSYVAAGKEDDARKLMYGNATAPVNAGVGGLVPSDGIQAGDTDMFPTGVRLGFGDSPDVTTVAWTKAGGPASPYFPDTRSPDQGTGLPQASAPDAAIPAEIVAEATKEDPSGQNLKNPAKDGPAIYLANKLGSEKTDLGNSGGNV